MCGILLNFSVLTVLSGLFTFAPAAVAVPLESNRVIADVSFVSSTGKSDDTTTYHIVYSFDFTGWDTDWDESLDSGGAQDATRLGAIDFVLR